MYRLIVVCDDYLTEAQEKHLKEVFHEMNSDPYIGISSIDGDFTNRTDIKTVLNKIWKIPDLSIALIRVQVKQEKPNFPSFPWALLLAYLLFLLFLTLCTLLRQ